MSSQIPSQIPNTPAKPDGRRLRTERTRKRLIDAYLGLAYEHSPRMPTAVEVAERAGYSVRSVFERFPDMHNLQLAAADFAIERAATLTQPPLLEGDRLTRIKHQVDARARVCEIWGRLWQSMTANRGASVEMRERIRTLQQIYLARLAAAYDRELSSLPELPRQQTLISLAALTDVEAWMRLRELHDLSLDAGCALWIAAIDRLLPPTPDQV